MHYSVVLSLRASLEKHSFSERSETAVAAILFVANVRRPACEPFLLVAHQIDVFG
jgi:hypothetical protein